MGGPSSRRPAPRTSMPAPITKAPSLGNAKKPSGRSPRGSKQASPRVARGQPPPRPGRAADAAPSARGRGAARARGAPRAPSRTYPVAPVEEPKLPPRVASLAPAKDEKYVARAKNLGAPRDKRRYTAARHDDLASTRDAHSPEYMTRQGVHFVVGASWSKFFEMADTDKSGRVTFDELDHMLDHILRIRSLSRYERRVFWARVDVDDSGEATTRSSYKIFRQFDRDASGEMSFEELCAVVRNRFPGVSLGPAQLPDEDLQGLWKRLDVDRSSTVSVQEFMIFMRRHGAAYSMHKLTEYAKAKRGSRSAPSRRRSSPSTARGFYGSSSALNRALAWPCSGAAASTAASGATGRASSRRWTPTRAGASTSTSSSRPRAIGVARDQLGDRDLAGLWTHVDADGSGELTIDEFQQAAYCLQVEPWPDLLAANNAERLALVIERS
ncbi:aldo-keto reductase [Aureococcus anophagefferens]|uniref:Aldo-keto reductase n=1 Tax=Aureococcus anophagefferens TaxID=44056 RepID=A0ABR1GAC3_AURAN